MRALLLAVSSAPQIDEIEVDVINICTEKLGLAGTSPLQFRNRLQELSAMCT